MDAPPRATARTPLELHPRWSSTSRDVLLLLAGGALAVGVLLAVVGGSPTADAQLFSIAGTQLLSSDARHVFADPDLQVGPLYLLLTGVGARAAALVGLDPVTGSLLLPAWALVAGLVAVAAAALPTATALGRRGLLVHVLLGGPLTLALMAGHLEDLLAVLAVAAAGWAVSQRRPLAAGVLVGAAACLKLWALLALAALLCQPEVRTALRSTLTAVGCIAVAYAPFLGSARTGARTWLAEAPSVLALVVPAGTTVTWVGRAVQLAAGMAVVALLLRGSHWDARAVWTVPAAVVCARLGTEPHVLLYYWCPAALAAALFLWSSPRPPVAALAGASVCTLVLLALVGATGAAASVLTTLLVGAGTWQVWRRARAAEPPVRRLDAAGVSA